jgi:hypothetical protein
VLFITLGKFSDHLHVYTYYIQFVLQPKTFSSMSTAVFRIEREFYRFPLFIKIVHFIHVYDYNFGAPNGSTGVPFVFDMQA